MPAGRGLGGILIALLLLGCNEKETSASAVTPAASPTVVVAPVEQQAVTQSVGFVGRVEALEKVDIRARVSGFLRDRHFQEGQAVKAGDLLFTIEREPFEAEAGVKQAKIESAEAALTYASYQVDRGRELVRTNAIPRATLDQRIAEQGVAAATLSGAKADLRLVEVNLGYTEIRSPIDGRVGRAAITRGNVVGPDSGVLTVVVREDPIRATFPVSQRQLLDMRKDARGRGPEFLRVRVRLPNGSAYDQVGRINFIDVQTDKATDTALVQAQIPNPAGILSDGQFIGLSVEGEEPQQALVIPQSAVQIDQAGTFVLVVAKDNKVEQRRVKLGRGPAGQAVVENGLDPGTLVITEGAQRARPGAQVVPKPAADLPPAGPIVVPAG
ncbi:efflux RND transporter periplasmic adaptor subunit [Dankookia sp. GCM10030260]|uniref:efflux RND transporter periplasmic adaptor subunit n=1 Tax=Dankookia sp. GCM10030260 TaxID=3273390 RepID=UPI00360E06D8